ncbi:MAG: TRAP transporter large permease subunit, partial [Pseudohongiellaceae bacterium]
MTDKITVRADSDDTPEEEIIELQRYRKLGYRWRATMAILTGVSTLLAINQIFNLGFFLDSVMLDSRYMYLITGSMLSMVFITFPSHRGTLNHVPWYDVAVIAVIAVVFAYFAFNAERIVLEAWEYAAPPVGIALSLITWAIVLEAGRRAGGWPIFFIVLVLSAYPMYAHLMPDVVAGIGMPIHDVAIFHIMGAESLFGIPMEAFAQLVFGFLLFGVALQYTGGGPFFINLAFALLGNMRGGPAKVAIFSSGLMGSMSGGPVTNVLTTGPLSIPAMRRIGFTRQYAAGGGGR